MVLSEKDETRCYSRQQESWLMMALSVMLILVLSAACLAAQQENAGHYKMVSTVEYGGKGQFRNQAETLFEVEKQALPNNRVRYSLLGNGNVSDTGQESSPRTLDFILDRSTRQVSGVGQDLAFWAKVNNGSIRSLQKVTKDSIGKTWKQSFALSRFDESLPGTLTLTLTAMEFKTKAFGPMIAVRALSEPFFARVDRGSLRCRVNTVYLFDPEIEEIYLSTSVFEAITNSYGFKEILRHEVATYRTDGTGASVDLTGLGKDFEKFVQQIGLSRKGIKVTDETPLPQWAQSEGLAAAQVALICGAMACEGAANPVVIVCIPAAQTVAGQSLGRIPTLGKLATAETVAGTVGKSVPGIGTMKIAARPEFFGLGLDTAAAVGGLGAGVAAGIENNRGHGRSNRSPIVP